MPTVLSFRLSIHYLLSRVGIQTRHSYLTRALAGGDRPLLQSASLRNRAWSPGVDARPSPNFPQSWYTNASRHAIVTLHARWRAGTALSYKAHPFVIEPGPQASTRVLLLTFPRAGIRMHPSPR